MQDGAGAGRNDRPAAAAVDPEHPGGRADRFPVRFPVVALIASAGGVSALVRVLRPLPGDLPAAVLIALHQDPVRVSNLAAILQRDTRLPIAVADQDTAMRPGCALVVPPGWHLLVTSEARLGLIETGELPPSRPSADLLLSTLAVTCGSRALAVVLTGMGHDGQAGIRAIAHCVARCWPKTKPRRSSFPCRRPPSPPITWTRSSVWTPSPTPSYDTLPEHGTRPYEEHGRRRVPR